MRLNEAISGYQKDQGCGWRPSPLGFGSQPPEGTGHIISHRYFGQQTGRTPRPRFFVS